MITQNDRHDLLGEVIRRSANLLLHDKGLDVLSTIERTMDELEYPENDDIILDDVVTMVKGRMNKMRTTKKEKLTEQERENLQLQQAEKLMNQKVKQAFPVRSSTRDDDWSDNVANAHYSQLEAWNKTLDVIDLLGAKLQQADVHQETIV